MFKIKINVYLKENILDPQGKAVNNALHQLGFDHVSSVRVGKYIEIISHDADHLENKVKEMCRQLLVNDVMEDVHFTIEKIGS